MKTNLPRMFALLLILSLLLAGCADAPADIAGKVQTLPPETTLPAAEENPLALGRMDGGIYTNTYAGFGCQLDSSWTFLSAEELQDLPASVAEQLEGSEIEKYMTEAKQITDMMAENVELLCSMNVLYQEVSTQDRLAFAAIGESAMIDMILEENKDIMISSYKQLGIEVTSMEHITVTFLGKNRSALFTTATTQGIPVYLVQLFDYSRGSYSVTSTFTSYYENNTQAMLDLFFEVD